MSHLPSVAAHDFYVTGGTLRRDAACYVVRQADGELHDALKQGKFCYVLTARQMGKSSLMVRTAARLREEGVGVAVLDLTAVGQNLTAEQWYGGLLSQMGQQLDLENELEEFWEAHSKLPPLLRWMRGIRQVVLPRYLGKVVIFIDEIDSVRSLPFSTDEFFAGIREFYNSRTEDLELERLTFCLLGVATPSDLIRDTRTTPFNIGYRIELHDFTEEEASQLTRGMRREENVARSLLRRVLYWTGGHPYLTQRLCLAVAGDASANDRKGVDRICEELFFSRRARERDDNLLFVRERMLRSEVDLAELLTLYQTVRHGRRVPDDETNPLVSILRLSGITRVDNGRLSVRNRIYERVFDSEWILSNMPDAEMRRQRVAYRRGLLRAGAAAALVVLVIASFAVIAVQQRNRAVRRAEDLRQLVGTVTSEINTLLKDLPKSTAVRHKLVLASVKYLDRLSGETTDPVLLSELAEGYSQLAEITGTQSVRSMGDLPAAVDLHKRAQALIERSSRDEPNNLAIWERHVWILLRLAETQPAAEAKQSILLAERLFESLRGKVPETEPLLELEANVNRPLLAGVHGWDSPENRRLRERTRVIYEKLCARQPDNLSYKLKLAECIQGLADFIPDLARRVEQCQAAQALRREVLQRDPQNPWYQMSYYMGSNSVARQYRLAGNPKAGLPFIREGMNHMRRASELDPDDASTRGHLAFALGDMAQLEAEVGNRREAEAAAMESIPLANGLLAKDANLWRANWGLGLAYRSLGDAGVGDRCAHYAKALFHARKADSFKMNPAISDLIDKVERNRRGCSGP